MYFQLTGKLKRNVCGGYIRRDPEDKCYR